MKTDNSKRIDLFVCGSSFASGVGQGKENIKHDQPSWVQYYADGDHCDNVWNISLPGRSLGSTTADVAEFGRHYYEKFRNYDKLFILIELTFPNYRQWDPIAMARNDTKELVMPVTYFRMLNSQSQSINSKILLSDDEDELRYVEKQFYRRTNLNFLDHVYDRHDAIYEEVPQSDLNQEQLSKLDNQIKQWFEYDWRDDEQGKKTWSESKSLKFLRYAADEIYVLRNNLEHRSVPYLMFWAGSDRDENSKFARKVDRVFKPIIDSNRMIPMSDFTLMDYAKKYSIKLYRGHPDSIGHQKIADFLLNWVYTHNLKQRPQTNLLKNSWGGT